MWFKIQKQQVILQIIAKPNAKKTAILKSTEQGLHISIHAKPLKGEANKELILFLSKVFKVAKSQIILKSGENSRYKQVMLPFTDIVLQILTNLSSLQ